MTAPPLGCRCRGKCRTCHPLTRVASGPLTRVTYGRLRWWEKLLTLLQS